MVISLLDYKFEIIILIILGIILFCIALLLLKKRKLKENTRAVVSLMIVTSLLFFYCSYSLFVEMNHVYNESHPRYKYSLVISPSNNQSFQIYFPIPDRDLLNYGSTLGNASIRTNETDHGWALLIVGNGLVAVFSEKDEASNLALSLQWHDKYYIFKNSNTSNIIHVKFRFQYSESDTGNTRYFDGDLMNDWNCYTFILGG